MPNGASVTVATKSANSAALCVCNTSVIAPVVRHAASCVFAAVVAFANLMRMVVERAALDLMENVQRGTGLPAFMNGNPVERIVRDLATYLRQPVPDLVMNDAARAVLAGELAIGRYR